MSGRDGGTKALSMVMAVVINGGVFVGMAYAGLMGGEVEEEKPLDVVDVSLEPLPIKGKEPEPNALPRIVKTPEPPPPETDTASLSREKKEEELEEKKREEEEKKRLAEEERKRKEEEERKRKEEEERKRKKREEKERRDRKRAMERAMDDVRADSEDLPPGMEDGHESGTSTNTNLNQDAYISLVSAVLSRQFKAPAVIPEDELRKLEAVVSFKIDSNGKVKGEPKLTQSSGNRFFDQAAVSAVNRFGPGTALKIPLPTNAALKRVVLRQGIDAIIRKRS